MILFYVIKSLLLVVFTCHAKVPPAQVAPTDELDPNLVRGVKPFSPHKKNFSGCYYEIITR